MSAALISFAFLVAIMFARQIPSIRRRRRTPQREGQERNRGLAAAKWGFCVLTLIVAGIAWVLIQSDHGGAAWVALALSAVPFAVTGYLAHLEQRGAKE